MTAIPSQTEIDQYREIAAWIFGVAMILLFFVIWASICWPEGDGR